MPRGKNLRPISVAVTATPGLWVSFVTVGKKPNGKSDRRKVSAAMCAECKADRARAGRIAAAKGGCACYGVQVGKVRELEDKAAAKAVARPGRRPTVRQWFTMWLTDIAPYQPSAGDREPLRRLTLDNYWSRCKVWIFPHLENIDLEELETTDLDRLYKAMYAAGRSSNHVRAVHSVIKRGLSLALARGMIRRNVARDYGKPGAAKGKKAKALSRAQVDTLLATIESRPDRLRWKVGLAIGPRQCEGLAIRWQYLDLDTGIVDTSWQIQRHGWRHGCADPATCGPEPGKTWHVRPAVCDGGPKHDRYHRRGCPKPRAKVCGPKCDGHAARCPQRRDGGIVFTRPKTYRDDSDQHLVKLPAPIVAELREHRKAQAAARLKAGSRWHDYDVVFCQANGQPLEPRKDYDRWRGVLKSAGLEEVGTHAMRATAATMLIRMGVPIEIVQEVLGHASIQQTRRYIEVDVGLTGVAADAMAAVFAGTATDLATVRARRRKMG